ncbi:afadin- and alpha-actinin-binding protein-like [Clytia hemisphaerica]|uniref:afadin- and alpha-actinin-binding protein-like n=1 Tax=Clytia hemisphaerica TaxID=252671 RepID=UPI0034D5BD45
MPFFMIKTEVEDKFQQILANLRDRLENTTPKEQSPKKDEKSSLTINPSSTDELQQRLEQCKAVITGQEAIIQELKEGYSQEAFERALLTFGLSEENYEASEKRLKKLREEEEKLCEERKNFTDYVLKVSKEREEFEKERVEFYMHCISTPVLNKDKKLNPRSGISTKHSLRMATPAFSPAPSIFASSKKERLPTSKQMPSTAELYRFMSLNYDGSVSRNLDRNLNGSFVQADTSPDGSPSPKKLHEHAENIRRAVEEHHNKSIEESVTELQKTPRSHTSSNTGFSGGEIPFYLME